MKISAKKIKETLETEYGLLIQYRNKATIWYEKVEYHIRAEFVKWLLDEVFTGHIYMTPSQLKRKGVWK